MTFTFKAHEKGLVHGQLFKILLGLVTHQKVCVNYHNI